MKKTVEAPVVRRATRSWIPIATTFLGIGIGVSGTLTFQHFNPQNATQSSTRSSDEAVPDALKNIVPPFADTPTNAPIANAPIADAPTANAPTSIAPTNAPFANSQTAQMALSQGNALYDARNWSQAALQYEQALAGGLDNADVRTDLGNCYRFLDQPQKALDQYRRAQKQNPQHEQSLFNQGGLYAFSLKDNARAIAKWREYIQRFPQGATANEARQLIAQAQSGQLPQTNASATSKP